MRHLSFLPLFIVLASACSSEPSSEPAPNNLPASSPEITPPASTPNPGESEESKEKPKDPTTEIIFGIDSESWKLEGYNLTSFKIDVKVDGVVAASEDLPASGEPSSLPHETRVVAPKDKPEATVEIVVKGVMNDADVVTRRATTRFVKGKSLLAYIFLEVRCNNFGLLGGSGVSGPTCDKPSETCVGGKCVNETLTADQLPIYYADWATKPPSACGAGSASSIVLGQGMNAVTPLNDNDTVTVECGPQGGHHLWMALAMKDLAQSGTTTTFTATQPGTAVKVPATAYPYLWTPTSSSPSGALCELVALRFQLDTGGVKIKDLLGKPLDVTVNAEDKAGHKATATRHVNVAPDRAGGGMCRPLL